MKNLSCFDPEWKEGNAEETGLTSTASIKQKCVSELLREEG